MEQFEVFNSKLIFMFHFSDSYGICAFEGLLLFETQL